MYAPSLLLKTSVELGKKPWSRLAKRSETSGQAEGYRPPREDINSPDLYIPCSSSSYSRIDLCRRGLSSDGACDLHIALRHRRWCTIALWARTAWSGCIKSIGCARTPSDLVLTHVRLCTGIVFLEFVLIKLGTYLLNIGGEGTVVDLLAYSGYKFVGSALSVSLARHVLTGRQDHRDALDRPTPPQQMDVLVDFSLRFSRQLLLSRASLFFTISYTSQIRNSCDLSATLSSPIQH